MFDVHEMEVNFGPQHPSTHGVLRVLLKVDGERIVDAKPIIGYLHRGTEKLFENMAYPQCIPHTDRMDYVASATNNLGFVEAVEKLIGVTGQIPKRAQLMRVILSELQRISSHLLWLATHAIDIGAMTPFFYCFREREQVLDLFEAYCGARLTLNCMRIGGMPDDLPPGWLDDVERFVGKFDAGGRRVRVAADEQPHLEAPHRRHRRDLAGGSDRVGHHRPAAARLGRRVGPPPRAAVRVLSRAGVRDPDRQERRHVRPLPRPHGGDAPVEPHPQAVHPADQSRRRRATSKRRSPASSVRPRARSITPSSRRKGSSGTTSSATARSQNAYRCHVRPPSFVNLQALPAMAKGHLVSDLVALIGTIDIVLGEVDR